VKALYEFLQAKAGRKWKLFSSEKVLQVSPQGVLSRTSS
jgi:hypothetical protein